jgi:predicted small lipoprotein YifL
MRTVLTAIAAMMLALAACGGGEPAEEAGAEETAPDTATADTAEAEVPVPEPEEPPGDAAEATAGAALGPQTNWSMTMGELSLALEGDSVTGEYPLGTLRGTIDDRVLTFEYVEGDLTGTGMLQFDRTFQSFTGYQVMGGDTLEWIGERL